MVASRYDKGPGADELSWESGTFDTSVADSAGER